MEHTEQKSYFDGANITRVPILRQSLKRTASESSENPPLKRPRLVPSSMAMKAGDIDIGSGYYNVRRKLEKAKKSTEGKAVQAIENNLSKLDLKMATSVEQAIDIHQQHVSNRLALRNFYNSKKRVKLKRTCEMQNDRFRKRLCAKERTFLIGKKEAGLTLSCSSETEARGVGSTIKGYKRYGGKWKQCMHGMNINVCITNENMTSQIYMYCFSKLDHPIHRKVIKGKDIKTKVKRLFLCRNPDCVLVSSKKAAKPRDNLSALPIGPSGLCLLLSQETFPELSAKISHCNTEFINKTASFLNARECWDTGHDASNRGKSKTFEKNVF
ncbi:hypothetical protein RMCBS344292_14001 [Rhizopus microsporus]|nr:hypothetical protein RMCBS344292_05442 [Rhizopus microsporus]CEI99926.1 hypothetical protein RMCBS344292_14001 [Rhizopus microsporus]